MKKYRKKPVCFNSGNSKHVHIIHYGQRIDLQVGDWIVAEPDGEHYYPVKPDYFEQTYEPVEES